MLSQFAKLGVSGFSAGGGKEELQRYLDCRPECLEEVKIGHTVVQSDE
jgi:hypothetical protein